MNRWDTISIDIYYFQNFTQQKLIRGKILFIYQILNMKSNTQLQKDVEDELNWSPMLDSAGIGVTAKEGVVTLTGVVDSYSKKLAAENAAKRVTGVKAIAQEIVDRARERLA